MRHRDKKALLVAVIVIGMASFYFLRKSRAPKPVAQTEAPAEPTYDPNDYQAIPPSKTKAPDYSGINVQSVVKTDKKMGKGAAATKDSTVKVKYAIWVYDPKKIGNKGLPIAGTERRVEQEIKVGQKKPFKGFEDGLVGLKAGGKRELIIPPDLAYGKNGQSPVPPGSILLVEVEMVSVR